MKKRQPDRGRERSARWLRRTHAAILGAVLLLGCVPAFAQRSEGALIVRAQVNPSIALAVQMESGLEFRGGGGAEASVTTLLPPGSLPAAPRPVIGLADAQIDAATSRIRVTARIAHSPASSGYRLTATLVGPASEGVEIDGSPLTPGLAIDITMARVLGDPYGHETVHTLTIGPSSQVSGRPASMMFVATPKPSGSSRSSGSDYLAPRFMSMPFRKAGVGGSSTFCTNSFP